MDDQEYRAYASKFNRISESDMHLRKCPRAYELWKELEMKVISAARPMLRTYVVCAGIVYGNGEETLFPMFKRAWTGSELPVVGEGNNLLPMVHAADLATTIKRVIDLNPSQSYVFAVDAA